METRIDFLRLLQTDVALNILMFLDDPADLVRAGAVSCFWRHFGELLAPYIFSMHVVVNHYMYVVLFKLLDVHEWRLVVLSCWTGIPISGLRLILLLI